MRFEINNYEESCSLHLCTELDVRTAGIQYDLLCYFTLPADAQGEGHTSSQSSRAQHFGRLFHLHYRLPTNRMCVTYTLQGRLHKRVNNTVRPYTTSKI